MFLDPEKPISEHRWGLPHWHQDGTYVFVTWRLADSLPIAVVQRLQIERNEWTLSHPKPWDQKIALECQRRFVLPLEEKLDDCHGSCCLRDPNNRRIVTDALHHFDQQRYHLSSYVVMPNHVHVLLQLREAFPLAEVIHSLKRFTARELNKQLNRREPLWQSKYWDRLIRSQRHFNWVTKYIEKNPGRLPQEQFTLWSEGL